MHNQLLKRSLMVALIAVIFALTSVHLIRTIGDSDFFWHLKTGEWIWQHKSLPSEDPFSYTSMGLQSTREHFILTSYWLTQVIYYLTYLAGGMTGIVFLRFIFTGVLIYALLRLKEGDDVLYLCLMVIFLAVFLEGYSIERPQVFSFLFFAVLLHLLRKIKSSPDGGPGLRPGTEILLLPALMLLWANMHGGYVLGQVVIVLFLLVEGLKFIHPSLGPVKKEVYGRLLTSGAAGIIFSLVNPNTYHALPEMMRMSGFLVLYTNEYKSTPEAFRMFNDYSILLYWLTLFLTAAGFALRPKKTDLTEVVLLAGAGFFSFTRIRYMPFFMISALPFMGRLFFEGGLLKPFRVFILFVALFSGSYFTWNERANFGNLMSGTWVERFFFPANAVDFIIGSNLRGNMYNHNMWGGYLIWRLSPERKVFIDSRALDEQVVARALLIDGAYAKEIAGMPAWRSNLEAYNVTYILIPFFQPEGPILPLLTALLQDKDWVPVFFHLNSVIFVKDSPENYRTIRTYSIPKDFFIEDLIQVCNRLIKASPRNISPYIAKGDLYIISRAGFEKAREAYQKAIDIAPLNPIAKERKKLLETRKNGS